MSKRAKIAALTVGVGVAAFTIANSTLQSQPLPSASTTSLPPIGLLPKPAQIVVEGVTKKAVTIANPRQAEGLTFFVTDVATSSRGVILSVPEFGPSGTIIFGGETGSGGGFRDRFLAGAARKKCDNRHDRALGGYSLAVALFVLLAAAAGAGVVASDLGCCSADGLDLLPAALGLHGGGLIGGGRGEGGVGGVSVGQGHLERGGGGFALFGRTGVDLEHHTDDPFA